MVRNYKRKTEDRWTKEDLLEALCAIQDRHLKINDAARQYGISRATLYRQFTKFITNGGHRDVSQFRTCGGSPILTQVEEVVLKDTVATLLETCKVTSTDIKRICFEYCWENGIPNHFHELKRMASDDWYYGFLKRHPDLRQKMSLPHPTVEKSANGETCEPLPPTSSGKASGTRKSNKNTASVTSSAGEKPLKRLKGSINPGIIIHLSRKEFSAGQGADEDVEIPGNGKENDGILQTRQDKVDMNEGGEPDAVIKMSSNVEYLTNQKLVHEI